MSGNRTTVDGDPNQACVDVLFEGNASVGEFSFCNNTLDGWLSWRIDGGNTHALGTVNNIRLCGNTIVSNTAGIDFDIVQLLDDTTEYPT